MINHDHMCLLVEGPGDSDLYALFCLKVLSFGYTGKESKGVPELQVKVLKGVHFPTWFP